MLSLTLCLMTTMTANAMQGYLVPRSQKSAALLGGLQKRFAAGDPELAESGSMKLPGMVLDDWVFRDVPALIQRQCGNLAEHFCDLTNERISDLSGMTLPPHLTSVYLNKNLLTDLNGDVTWPPVMGFLNVGDNKITKLRQSFLNSLPQTTHELNVSYNAITNLRVAIPAQLQCLHLSGNKGITDFSTVTWTPGMESLSLDAMDLNYAAFNTINWESLTGLIHLFIDRNLACEAKGDAFIPFLHRLPATLPVLKVDAATMMDHMKNRIPINLPHLYHVTIVQQIGEPEFTSGLRDVQEFFGAGIDLYGDVHTVDRYGNLKAKRALEINPN